MQVTYISVNRIRACTVSKLNGEGSAGAGFGGVAEMDVGHIHYTIVLMTSYDDSNLESRCKETQVPNIHSLAKKAIRMLGAVPIPSDMKCGQLCSCLPTL
jgi:hypothetical protein